MKEISRKSPTNLPKWTLPEPFTSLVQAAIKIQRAWRARPRQVALLRLINSEARRRHVARRSFQTRAELQIEATSGPSIWQMMRLGHGHAAYVRQGSAVPC